MTTLVELCQQPGTKGIDALRSILGGPEIEAILAFPSAANVVDWVATCIRKLVADGRRNDSVALFRVVIEGTRPYNLSSRMTAWRLPMPSLTDEEWLRYAGAVLVDFELARYDSVLAAYDVQ